jgi:hypothetical protein
MREEKIKMKKKIEREGQEGEKQRRKTREKEHCETGGRKARISPHGNFSLNFDQFSWLIFRCLFTKFHKF